MSHSFSKNNDDKTGILRFLQCDDKYPLCNLQKDELKVPDYLEKDITLSSLRASDKFRIIGYRQEEYFYIVWFDRNHITY